MVLQEAGVVLGSTYPRPLVEHGGARRRALLAYEAMRAAGRRRTGPRRRP